jgi:hypothetical protein
MHMSKDKKYSVVPKKVSYQCFFQDFWTVFSDGKRSVKIGAEVGSQNVFGCARIIMVGD